MTLAEREEWQRTPHAYDLRWPEYCCQKYGLWPGSTGSRRERRAARADCVAAADPVGMDAAARDVLAGRLTPERADELAAILDGLAALVGKHGVTVVIEGEEPVGDSSA